MSDQMNENLPQQAQEQPEPTRMMPPVEPPSRPVRHRRSDRYANETPEQPSAPASDAPAAPEPGASAPAQPGVRVIPKAETGRHPVVPRPNSLNRAEQARQAAAARMEEEANAARRPMGTPPGFTTPRPPLDLHAQEPSKGPFVQHVGTGTGSRQPVTVPGGESHHHHHSGHHSGSNRPKRHRPLLALVIVLLLIGIVIVGVMMFGQGENGLVDQVRGLIVRASDEPSVAASASGFTAAVDRGTAPMDVVFNLTTSKTVTQVRLVDESGIALDAACAPVTENADSIIWMMNLTVNDGFEGLVYAQIFDGTNWIDTGRSQSLSIAPPAPTTMVDMVDAFNELTGEEMEASTEAPMEVFTEIPTEVLTEIPTEVPTEIPTDIPTDVPTEAPTEEPVEEATATPTMAVTDTPTAAPAATPTLPPASEAATQAPVLAGLSDSVDVGESAMSLDETTDEPVDEPQDEFPQEELPNEEPDTAETTAIPSATPPLTGTADASADPSLIAETVVYEGSSKTATENFTRERLMNMPISDGYLAQPFGVLTYRGNAFRQNAAVGSVGEISSLSLSWTAEAGSVKAASSTYYGIGWTGQPAIIKWSKEVRAATNIVEEKKNTSALKEVIVAGLDGKIYFLDLADGQPTRDPINLGYMMKGTPSLHPLGYPIMAVGQFGRKMANHTGDIGLRVYNLLTQKQVYWIDGLDGDINRPYYEVGAFDTSPLIDPNSDTMVAVGTNGMLYTVELNTEYSVAEETVKISPSQVSMKSKTDKQADKNTAVQSSPAMYGTYVYYADMEGILRCVDTTTMTTVWAVDTEDAVEAAIALDMDEAGNLWLYTANTLETRKRGDCTIRRYNALTGAADWSLAVNVAEAKNGKVPGAMASPVIGQNGLNDLVYFTLSNVTADGAKAILGSEEAEALSGVLLAISKTTGEVVWTYALDGYGYSSPVAVYAENGQGWIVQASSTGVITLLDGLTGAVVNTLEVEGTIEASPAVYNNTLVIGTTGRNTSFIYGIKLQ